MKESKINWHYLDKVGTPSKEVCTKANGAPREFLLKGEFSITCAHVLEDGSGFATHQEYADSIVAWAIVDGF